MSYLEVEYLLIDIVKFTAVAYLAKMYISWVWNKTKQGYKSGRR